MQIATTLHRGWLSATQQRKPIVCRFNRAAGRTLSSMGAVSFSCPVCGYKGPFAPFKGRKDAMCISCGALERHRMQRLVLDVLPERALFAGMSVLHVAPEEFFASLFRQWFRKYTSCDLDPKGVDFKADLTCLPFPTASFDVVYASHVLEHIQDDRLALREIHRVLRPGGLAIVPVPIFTGIRTVEYRHAVSTETDHWRQPGTLDYFTRHYSIFSNVTLYASHHFPAEHQLYSLEDRSHWPTKEMPYRLPVSGSRHMDIVPVCYKAI